MGYRFHFKWSGLQFNFDEVKISNILSIKEFIHKFHCKYYESDTVSVFVI